MKYPAILLILLGVAGIADAAEFHLKDGSVVVGKILKLAYGEDLIVDTEYMDEVTIEWDAVEQIRGAQVVDVEFFDGRRVIGAIIFDDEGVSIRGVENFQVRPDQVFSIEEVNEGFWDSLEIFTDLGMNLVRGNNQVTQVSLGAGVGYDAQNFEVSLSGTNILNEQTEAPDTRRATLSGNYTQKLPRGWQVVGLYSFEADEQQNLDGRSLLGVAGGKRIFNRRRQLLELYAGFALNQENFTDQPTSESVEGLIGTRYRLRTAVDIDASLSVLPNLEQSGRLRTQFDASMSFDLFKDLDFKLTVYDRYDSDPPAGNKNHDSGLTLGLSYEY